MESAAASIRPESTATENMVNDAMPQMPVARPSRPSMRLMMLVNATK